MCLEKKEWWLRAPNLGVPAVDGASFRSGVSQPGPPLGHELICPDIFEEGAGGGRRLEGES